MSFQYLTNIPLAEARRTYFQGLQAGRFQAGTERIPAAESFGRVTAQAVYAAICAPHYPACAMDGIALAAGLTFGAGETTPVTLAQDQFVTVDTGDPLPEGCDAVVMIEEVIPQEDGTVRLYAPASPWQHIRQIGEDICAGEMILPSYTKISPSAIGAMIAGGVLEVEVLKRPVVGIIPTGDEIVPPTTAPAAGDILEFNSSIFSAMLTEWGAIPRTWPIVKDQKPLIREAVSQALEACDVVLLNAGSSAGREDFSAEVVGELGQVLVHGIAIKPGKPAILGIAQGKPVLGVPGYPVSGIIVLEQILKPLLDRWFHQPEEEPEIRQAVLTKTVMSGLKYQEFVRVRLGQVGDKLTASPLGRGSGVVSSFMKADGILEIPQETEGLKAGSAVPVRLLKSPALLSQALVVIGSHDPLLDEVADLLRFAGPSLTMSSSHVGSMGGIMAIKRGEAHAAGIHLLDEESGGYNTAFVRRYFPQGGVCLVECVGRTQGLMLAPGNPRQIGSIRDLTGAGLRYVNRQKGSGTRILIDYLCKREGIAPADIYGYDREEFTHTSVAVQIASGTADAGMGIYSAAKLYGLDFLPICTEQYDLLISDAAWETEPVQRLISILQSQAFRTRLEGMGGYQLDRPGRIRESF